MSDAEREAWTRIYGTPEEQRAPAPKRASKFGNKKTKEGGVLFDSNREAQRWLVLQNRLAMGEISDLRRQVTFELTTMPRDPQDAILRGFIVVSKYVADFVYVEKGKTVVEDAKGMKTDVYRLKKRHFEAEYGIAITET